MRRNARCLIVASALAVVFAGAEAVVFVTFMEQLLHASHVWLYQVML